MDLVQHTYEALQRGVRGAIPCAAKAPATVGLPREKVYRMPDVGTGSTWDPSTRTVLIKDEEE